MRFLFGRHPLVAGWLLAAALLMKMLVPAGYMAMASKGSITIAICSGYGPATVTLPTAIAAFDDTAMAASMPAMAHPDGEDDGKDKQPCPFATLTASPLAPGLVPSDMAAVLPLAVLPTVRQVVTAPGRGMAAPPPPSHAPPAART